MSILPYFDEENLSFDDVRRQSPRVKGILIAGAIEGKEIYFTVDTGASRTVLSEEVWKQLPVEVQQKVMKPEKRQLIGPNGTPIKALGRVLLNLQLGPVNLEKCVTVAEIRDDCLLGADILLGLEEGPFDLLLSEGRLKWNKESIPCIYSGTQTLRRVVCSKSYTVPGRSEVIVDLKLIGGELERDENLLIEPISEFQERNQLAVASSVVNLNNPQSLKLRMINPSSEIVKIHMGEVLGTVMPIQEIVTLFEDDEIENKIDINDAELCRKTTHELNMEIESTPCDSTCNVPEHLRDLLERSTKGKASWKKQQVAQLLRNYQSTFSKDEFDLGCTHLAEHQIDTGNTKPVKQPPRRIPLALQGKDKEAIEKMLKSGAIRKSTSPWASPIVLVRKKDGSVRLCTDYRTVNSFTKKDAFPLPKIADCLDAVAGAKYFSTLDLTSGYNQIPVAKEDIPKTAFVTKHGLFECPKLPFGLTNAPATFQRVMELALQGLQWNICLVYIDDIIIYSTNFIDHISRLKQVLERLQISNLKVKPDKCQLFEDSVLFLGHIISKDGVLPSPGNIDKVLNWPAPRSTKEVRQFLGAATYYRRFVKDFACKARPLSELTSKNVIFSWNQECQDSFDELKKALTGPEVMAYPTNEGYFVLDSNWSCAEHNTR